ncbi:hypothetical protein GKZ68_00705 [Hymenobacter sp. BRD128]|uniref:hypothetical protein n=1 Tax=Hymenobacter sp. BRD128 TaxID=2675878 RepID=UPI001566353F|nr:hypothetical protein [Hymenobacter sp. BRD128]QKG55282.1 hypothetical protein GKZ68_00705 [Hymenobacter sp. BRD128]
MRYAPRAFWLAAPALTALSLLASCSDKPKETDTSKTAVVVPSNANSAADSTAKMKTDSTVAPK